jgi:hypothetical protein
MKPYNRKKTMSGIKADHLNMCWNPIFIGSKPGDYFYAHNLHIICLLDLEEHSKYLVYNREGLLLTSDHAESIDAACHGAESFLAEYYPCTEDTNGNCGKYKEVGVCYPQYRIQVNNITNRCYVYLIFDNANNTLIAANISSYRNVAIYCAKAWVRHNRPEYSHQ